MANIQDIFNISGYATPQAMKLAVEQQAQELTTFILGLKQRKSQVFSEVVNFENLTYDAVVTLSSLLLQMNLYCRKTRSTLLLRQLNVEELVDAINAYYKQDYTSVIMHIKFLRQLFLCFV